MDAAAARYHAGDCPSAFNYRRARFGAMCLLISYWPIVGCTLLNPAATTREESPPTSEPAEPPQVVQNDQSGSGDASNGELHGVIKTWVDRVVSAKRPLASAKTETETMAALTADQAPSPASGDPVGPPPIDDPNPAGSAAGADDAHSRSAKPSPPAPLPSRSRDQAGLGVPAASPPLPAPLTIGETPAVNAPVSAAGAPTTLADVLDRLGPPADDSFREQLDRRMMWVIAGEYDRAREPLAVVTAEQQELATRFIEAWVAIRDGQASDPTGAIQAATRELNQLQTALQKLSDLRLPVLRICSAVYGYGQFDALEPARFNAGVPNEFVLYCEVSDFVSEQGEDGWYTSKFDLTSTILNRAGEAVHELKDTNIADRCRNRRRDCFIPRLVRLPASLAPGSYVAKITIVDKLGQKVAQERATFQLVARP